MSIKRSSLGNTLTEEGKILPGSSSFVAATSRALKPPVFDLQQQGGGSSFASLAASLPDSNSTLGQTHASTRVSLQQGTNGTTSQAQASSRTTILGAFDGLNLSLSQTSADNVGTTSEAAKQLELRRAIKELDEAESSKAKVKKNEMSLLMEHAFQSYDKEVEQSGLLGARGKSSKATESSRRGNARKQKLRNRGQAYSDKVEAKVSKVMRKENRKQRLRSVY